MNDTKQQSRKSGFYASPDKPGVIGVFVDNIPAELRERRQWVAWRLVWDEKKGKWDKPPFNPHTGHKASSTDPTTWGTFDDALKAYQRADGIGFVFASDDPYTGIDLDDAMDDDGNLFPWAAAIASDLSTYAETSPSGTGIKLWIRGTLPPHCKHKREYASGEIEVYDRGRYFTVTGRTLPGAPNEIGERQAQLDKLLVQAKLIAPPAGATTTTNGKPRATPNLTDAALIAKASASKNGAKFMRLWKGDATEYNGDESRADLALCSTLGFWCGHDAGRIDSLFRQSGLMREKWLERRGEKTYGEMTIALAIKGKTEGYSGNGRASLRISSGQTEACATLQPAPVLLSEHLTDVGNGRRLVVLHGADLRYCHPWGKWIVWDGRRWREDDQGEPERRAKDACRALLESAARYAADLAARVAQAESEDQAAALQAKIEQMQALQLFAIKSESAPRIKAMIDLATSEPGVPILPTTLNMNAWMFCCENGMLDLRTGKLREHRRDDANTQLCPVPFDPAATCPTWQRFLEQVFQGKLDLIQFVQRLLGYTLTGTVGEQILPIFWGTGANGKSTLLNCWLAVLGTDFGGKAPSAMLTPAKGERHPTELATLFGKRLVAAVETEAGARLAESLVKELTGGDPITARRMREDFWTFQPTHKIIVCTNHKPKVTGRDHAIWRRLRLVPFNRRFEKAEQDSTLPAKLAAEATGILAWAVRGCLDWQRYGLGEPPEVQAATAEYRNGEDVLATWMADCCLVEKLRKPTRATDLFQSYQQWAKNANEKSNLTQRGFNAAMREAGFDEVHADGLRFLGIELLPNPDGATERWSKIPS